MKTLYLIRHGQTALNGQGDSTEKVRGWLNVPLTKEGHEQAARIGQYLNGKLQKTYTSDLTRAQQTASHLSPPAEVDKAFRPWDLGAFSGMKVDDVKQQMNYYVKNPEESVPGGESFNTFLQRYLPKLKEVIGSMNASTGIVTHYRNLKAAMAWREAGMKDDLSFDKKTMLKDDLEPGAVIQWDLNG